MMSDLQKVLLVIATGIMVLSVGIGMIYHAQAKTPEQRTKAIKHIAISIVMYIPIAFLLIVS